MLTLFDYQPSQNAWKVRALLKALHTPYQQAFVSIFEAEGQQAEFLRINPTGAVPAIKLESGQTIAESNAILFYLAQGTAFLPVDPIGQSQVLQWLFFESDYVQSSIATLRHWVLTGKHKNRTPDMLQSKRDASEKVLNTLNNTLANRIFLCGGTYTIADMSVYAYVHLTEDTGLSLSSYPCIEKWIDSVRSQPNFLHEVFPYSIDRHSYKEL